MMDFLASSGAPETTLSWRKDRAEMAVSNTAVSGRFDPANDEPFGRKPIPITREFGLEPLSTNVGATHDGIAVQIMRTESRHSPTPPKYRATARSASTPTPIRGQEQDPPFERRPYPRQRDRLGPAHRSGHPLGPPATGPDIDSGVIQ